MEKTGNHEAGGWSAGKEARRWPDKAPTCSRKGAFPDQTTKEAKINKEAPHFEDKRPALPSKKRRGPESDATAGTAPQEQAPLQEEETSSQHSATTATEASTSTAAMAAQALSPHDPATGKHKKYKVWQTELRQAISGYHPAGETMKISHDSTFRQIAGVVQTVRGIQMEVANVTGEEAVRQALPAGTAMGRGKTAVYHAALKFLISQPK